MSKYVAIPLVLFTLLSAPVALAETPMAHQHDHSAMWKALHLTSAQQKRMEALHKEQMPELKAAYKTLRADIDTMLDLYADPDASEASMSAQYDKFQSDLDAAAHAHFNHMQSMRAILTPTQRKEFVARLRKDHGDAVQIGPMMGDGAH